MSMSAIRFHCQFGLEYWPIEQLYFLEENVEETFKEGSFY